MVRHSEKDSPAIEDNTASDILQADSLKQSLTQPEKQPLAEFLFALIGFINAVIA